MRTWTLCVAVMVWVCAAGVAGAGLRVAALHPLMADLARQVGRERVEVFDLVGAGGNPHRYEPRPEDLKRMRESDLVLAGGKKLEPYLDRLVASLGGVPVVEVGRTIPSLTVGKDVVYVCCPTHATGAVDPHWWHGIENMRRAARVVAQTFAERDPGGKDAYAANAAAYSQRLGAMKEEMRVALARVPRAQRKLVTAHNAFAYFAKEFGFEVISVAGLTKEQNNTPQDLARTMETVRRTKVASIFPEQDASTRIVESIARETGVAIGHPLIADGNGTGSEAGFEGMIRHNVSSIIRSLAP